MKNKKIYLAIPYTHKSIAVRAARAKFATQVAGRLMSAGPVVYSPITHGHAIAKECGLPGDFEYWQKTAESFLSWCTDLYVVCIPGWKKSVGVRAEILLAEKLGKTVVYLKSGDWFFDGFRDNYLCNRIRIKTRAAF